MLKTILLVLAGLVLVIGIYVLGVHNGTHRPLQVVGPAGTEQYADPGGSTLFLLVRSEGVYCGDHLIAATKLMDEIEWFVVKNRAARFYIAGGDDTKYSDVVSLMAKLRERYHYLIFVDPSYMPPTYRMPEASTPHVI